MLIIGKLREKKRKKIRGAILDASITGLFFGFFVWAILGLGCIRIMQEDGLLLGIIMWFSGWLMISFALGLLSFAMPDNYEELYLSCLCKEGDSWNVKHGICDILIVEEEIIDACDVVFDSFPGRDWQEAVVMCYREKDKIFIYHGDSYSDKHRIWVEKHGEVIFV